MNQPFSRNDAGTRCVRWWPVSVILLAMIAGLAWIWGYYQPSRQDQYIATAKVVLGGILLLWVWLLFFSRLRWLTRLGFLAGFVALLGLAVALIEIRGVSGDLVPILEWRWKEKPDAASPDPAPLPAPASEPRSASFDYPQFLGPNRNATLPGPDLVRDWAAHPPDLIWRRAVGAGWSGFAITGGRAVTQEQHGEEEQIVCYDLLTGRLNWSHADQARYFTTIAGEGPRATPTIVGDHVYALGATGLLNCLSLETGRLVWSRNMTEDHRCRVPDWGFSGSPLVTAGLVIVHPGGGDERSLVAYEADSGEFRWGGGNAGAGYSSPALVSFDGVEQVLMFNARSLSSHALSDGQVLWEYDWRGGHPHVAMPVVLPENRILVSSGYGTGSELVRISQSNALWSAERLWRSIRLKAKFTNVVMHEGHIYGLDDGIMVCLETATGELRWKEGRYGHGQVILVKNLLLVMAESGEVVLLDPVPEAHRELGRFTAFEGKTWNPPALAGNLLLIRNDKEAALYRLPVESR